ncbi:MAG: hypothetical protein OEL58_08895 [Desulfobacteraceae bacterium]|nr:hypothetical protein [Desulfobacteraceae bacterium]
MNKVLKQLRPPRMTRTKLRAVLCRQVDPNVSFRPYSVARPGPVN